MKINADLSRRAVVHAGDLPWVPSPLAGVDRRMLERDGEEVARATSIVRYAPQSSFSAHTHAKGEEFLVLNGIFSDASGDFGEGMYVRNPPASTHEPCSADGCEIFVKLRQMYPEESVPVRIDTTDQALWSETLDGESALSLYRDAHEEVRMLRWNETDFPRRVFTKGIEYFVLAGCFVDEQGEYAEGTWLRLPAGSSQTIRVLESTIVYVKSGHLGVE